MQRRIVLSIAILTFGLFCFVCVNVHSRMVERDISVRALQVLAANRATGVALSVDGRDVVLGGPASSREVADDAGKLIAALDGVRTVEVRLTGPPEALPDAKAISTKTATQSKLDALMAQRVVEFDPSSARLTARGRAVLDQVAPLIAFSSPSLLCEVEGHTDSSGNSESNRKLSFKRAIATKNYLVNRGIPPARLIAKAYGDSEPLASNRTAAGRQRNRRINFVLEEKP
jgi:outer membrane protein OmpA-like peptidoglycan-associated protein